MKLLQEQWQLWFCVNTVMSSTMLIITSAAVMESSTFHILDRCEVNDLRYVVGTRFKCTTPANVTHTFGFEDVFNNWELKVFHANAYIWGTTLILAVQELEWKYSFYSLSWITSVQVIMSAIVSPRQDFYLYYGNRDSSYVHTKDHLTGLKWESPQTALTYTLFAALAVLMSMTLTRMLSRLRRQRFACLIAMERRHDDVMVDIGRMTDAWTLSWSDIECVQHVASGSSGEVWRGLYRHKWEVAVKLMYDTQDVPLDAQSETRFLQRVRHPRLVMFIGCGRRDDDGSIFLVLEYCEHGSMSRLIQQSHDAETPLPWSLRMSLLVDVSEAMTHLHDVQMVHRDLKCENVMLCTEGMRIRAKVCDFGLSRITVGSRRKSFSSFVTANDSATKSQDSSVASERSASRQSFNVLRMETSISSIGSTTSSNSVPLLQSQALSSSTTKTHTSASSASTEQRTGDFRVVETSVAGTPSHLCPELLPELLDAMARYDNGITARDACRRIRCTPKADVYAFGIIMWEVLELKCAWRDYPPRALAKAVLSGKRPPISPTWPRPPPRGYVELMGACWTQMPSNRPTFRWIHQELLASSTPMVLTKSGQWKPRNMSTGTGSSLSNSNTESSLETPGTDGVGMSSPSLRFTTTTVNDDRNGGGSEKIFSWPPYVEK